jgi:hypothetical protein
MSYFRHWGRGLSQDDCRKAVDELVAQALFACGCKAHENNTIVTTEPFPANFSKALAKAGGLVRGGGIVVSENVYASMLVTCKDFFDPETYRDIDGDLLDERLVGYLFGSPVVVPRDFEENTAIVLSRSLKDWVRIDTCRE